MVGAHGEPPWLSEDEIEDLSYKERLDRAAACLQTAQTPLFQSGAPRFDRTDSSCFGNSSVLCNIPVGDRGKCGTHFVCALDE